MDSPTSKPITNPTVARGLADGGPTAGGFLAPPQQPDEIGRLGPYRVLGELGRGGAGIVYRAEDSLLNRPVAIKVLLPELAADPRAKARFVREAQAQAKVEHDHIVAIHQIGEANGRTVIVMPLLKGQTLAADLRRAPLPPVAEALRIGAEVAEGLAAAHAVGLVHRDIKPGNVWLEEPAGKVKILDFGLARPVVAPADDGREPLTAHGGVVGTPAYMAPEQARGEPVDHRADLFALGVLLYQMTTGRLPFTGANAFATLMAVTGHDPPAPHAIVPDVPPAVSALVQRLLAKDPAARPPSAAAVAAELRHLESAAPSGTADPWTEVAADSPARLSRPVPRGPFRKPLLAAAAALVGLVLGGVFAVRSGSKSEPPQPPANTKGDAPPARPVPPAAPDPDRAAANLMLSHGVEVKVRKTGGKSVTVRPGERLPDGQFEVFSLRFPATGPRAADFVPSVLIPAIRPLKALADVLDDNQTLRWSESDIVWLADAPFRDALEVLLTEFELNPATAAALARLPNLNRLQCGAGYVEDETLIALSQAPRLESVSLRDPGFVKPVTEKGWVALTGLPKLTHLLLERPRTFDRRACELLAAMPKLEKLRLSGIPLGTAELRALGGAKVLVDLELDSCGLSEGGLSHIAQLPKLKHLYLRRCSVDEAGFAALKTMTGLRLLVLNGSIVSEAEVKALATDLPNCVVSWDKGRLNEK